MAKTCMISEINVWKNDKKKKSPVVCGKALVQRKSKYCSAAVTVVRYSPKPRCFCRSRGATLGPVAFFLLLAFCEWQVSLSVQMPNIHNCLAVCATSGRSCVPS